MKVIYIMAAEFTLNTEELFADSLANHELDAYSSVNEAYESLLINRESETLLHELNDDENDFELGEVIKIDKLKNTANFEILTPDPFLFR
jgi:hypothetical protein